MITAFSFKEIDMTVQGAEFRDKNIQVTLNKDVEWGSTTYPAGKVITPDREFLDYLIAGGLAEEYGSKYGEHPPDIRTRSIDNNKTE
jgi:hypothetical protein